MSRTFFRSAPLRHSAEPRGEGGALWFPRSRQGEGRHDNPDLYGCLYASESEVSVIVEQLAPFRGAGALTERMLERGGATIALVSIIAPDELELVDLDDPVTLCAEELRPSQVATGVRSHTQADCVRLWERHASAAGLRWWSTFESSWLNVTLFDRAAASLRAGAQRALARSDPAVREAAEFLGLG